MNTGIYAIIRSHPPTSKRKCGVDAIASYIAADSIAYASTVVRKILEVTRNLNRFPLAGRIVPELDDKAIREHIVFSYRVIYRVEEKKITVVAVIHGKRMLEL